MTGKRSNEVKPMASVARAMLGALGMPDPSAFEAAKRLFDRLYGERFLDQVVFVGLRRKALHLRARDGAWKRRAQVLEPQILADFQEFLGEEELNRVVISTGPLPDLGPQH